MNVADEFRESWKDHGSGVKRKYGWTPMNHVHKVQQRSMVFGSCQRFDSRAHVTTLPQV
jgi:hypothetical protein